MAASSDLLPAVRTLISCPSFTTDLDFVGITSTVAAQASSSVLEGVGDGY